MVRNLWWRVSVLGLALVLGFPALVQSQETTPPDEQAPPAAEEESIPAPEAEESPENPTPSSAEALANALAESIMENAARQDLEMERQFSRLREQLADVREQQDPFKKPVTWFLLGFLLLMPVALFLLGYWSLQRLTLQHDELKRQRLRLEGVEEHLRDLPAHLPRPSLDVTRLAEHLREDLGLAATRVNPGPSTTATPFYHNDEWLPRAVEGSRRYLDHLREVRETMAEVYDDLSTTDDPGEALALTSWMLARFYHRRRSCAEDRWSHLLIVAEAEGYLVDPALSERLRQARTHEEAARTLHRALYRELLEHSISDHLILLEEMRHLPDFCGEEASRAACQAIGQRINPMVETFLNETRRLAGYTPNYVPLFSEMTEEAAHFIRNNASERLPGVYRHLELPRRQVLYVLAYGLRRERGWENEETQVILS